MELEITEAFDGIGKPALGAVLVSLGRGAILALDEVVSCASAVLLAGRVEESELALEIGSEVEEVVSALVDAVSCALAVTLDGGDGVAP